MKSITCTIFLAMIAGFVNSSSATENTPLSASCLAQIFEHMVPAFESNGYYHYTAKDMRIAQLMRLEGTSNDKRITYGAFVSGKPRSDGAIPNFLVPIVIIRNAKECYIQGDHFEDLG